MKLIFSIEPIRYPLTGIGRYTYELATRLASGRLGIEELRFFGIRGFVKNIPTSTEKGGSFHKVKELAQRSHLVSELYRLTSSALKAYALRDSGEFLYHGPNFFLPPFSGRKIATFHDLSPYKWADCITKERARFLQKELDRTIRSADALITDTEFTRNEIAEYFNWPLDRIFTAPLACGPEFRPRGRGELQAPLSRYSLVPGGYALYVGTIEPRKNVGGLLTAYSCLPLPLRQRFPLVLTGFRGWRSAAIHDQIRRAETEGWVRYLGFVPSQDLPFLYSGARVFAFPSHYEGFGLPVLEAMSSGIPVVCSSSSSIPEIAGEAALMCVPNDIRLLADYLNKALEDETWRGEARLKGLNRASQFTWEKCANETAHAYQRVML